MKYLLLLVTALSIFNLALSAFTASNKIYCWHDSDCGEDQFCLVKKCACKPKFVQNGIFCFPEAGYGEPCFFPEQCADFRQICSNTTGIRRCTCDMYHEYDNELSQCVPKRNLTDMLINEFDYEASIGAQADKTFKGILFAGLFVAIAGGLSLLVVLLFCCHMNYSDRKLEDQVKLLSAKAGKPVPTVKKPENKPQIADASIGPMCLAEVVIG